MERNYNLDIFKGVATFIMIFANTSSYFFNLSDNFIIRLIFSFAAPIFIISSGYITQKNLLNLNIPKSKILYRVFQILFFGVFIDVLFWHSIPFITFDVLYLIAFCQLFLLLTNKKYLVYSSILVLLTSILLHQIYFYRFHIPETKILNLNSLIISNPIKRLFFDGWFPIFPWLTFFLLGALSFNFSYLLSKYKKVFVILGFISIGFFLFIKNKSTFDVRENYLELWYPLNGYELLIPVAVFFMFIGLFYSLININSKYIKFFMELGKNTLLIYVLNALLVAFISDYSLTLNLSYTEKILLFCIVLIFLLLISVMFEKIKKTFFWTKTPKFIKFILCN
jgi:uncharacterized protein